MPGAGAARWATLAGLVVVATVWSAFSTAAQSGPLTDDLGAQFYLGKMTAHGAVPLVDFQHGWNAGSWWADALVYRMAGGDPMWWELLLGRLLGRGLAAVLGATMLLRRRAHPAAMVLAAVTVLAVVPPPQLKYALPVVFAFVLLPGTGGDGTQGVALVDRGRLAVVVRVLAPAVLWWQHVELAILLTGAAGLFELVGRRSAPLRTRLVRTLALAGGILLGLVSEVLFYAIGFGMSPAELNRQVVLGQAGVLPKHFGWPFFDVPTDRSDYVLVALLPYVLLLLFLPVIWRLASDPTRYLSLSALFLATIPIRRPGPGHAAATGALVALALVFLLCDLYLRRADLARLLLPVRLVTARLLRRAGHDPAPVSLRALCTPRRLAYAVVGLAAGAGWVAVALAYGFGTDSFAGPVILALVAAVLLLVARFWRTSLVAVSAGSLVVLTAVPLAASVERMGRLSADSRQYAALEQWAHGVRPELERCLDGGDQAMVVANYIGLYDILGIRNPTPFYLFHYDFGRNREELTTDLDTGRVPLILQVTPFPSGQQWMVDALHRDFEVCSVVRTQGSVMVARIWKQRSLEPFRKRQVTVDPTGRVVSDVAFVARP